MSERPDPCADARLWIEYAEADLRLAGVWRSDPKNCPEWAACYHAQQAAEKALKAIIIAAQRQHPFTHDIRVLLDLCEEIGGVWSAAVRESEILVSYAATSRYPSRARSLGQKEAEHAIVLAQRVLQAVHVRLDGGQD